MKLQLFILIFLSTSIVQAQNNLIDQFLNEVKSNSLQYKVKGLDALSKAIESQAELNMYNWNGQVSYIYYDIDEVSSSPFAPTVNTQNTYSLMASKKWGAGVTSNFSYALLDNQTNYQTGNQLKYLLPDLSLGLSTNLLQDLIYRSSQYQLKKVKANLSASQIELKINQKQVLTQALLAWADALKLTQQGLYQKNLCQNIKAQVNKLYKKSRSGAITKRDYYFSLKKLNTCEIQVNNMNILLNQQTSDLLVNYGVHWDSYQSMSLEQLAKQLQSIYGSRDFQPDKAQLDISTDILYLKSQQESLSAQQKQLQAEAKTPINLELKAGAKGLDNKFKPSHENVYELNNTYVTGTISIDLPFKNKQKQDELKIISYKSQILNHQLKIKKQQQKQNFLLLQNKINKELKVLDKLEKNVDLSQMAVNLAKKDFANGRLDFLVLSDYQSSLIESQKQLSDLYKTIISDFIVYFDHFNFFDRYH